MTPDYDDDSKWMNSVPDGLDSFGSLTSQRGTQTDASIFSFFSGLGFLDLGFEAAGFKSVFVNEYHPPFLAAYKYARERLHIEEPQAGYFEGDASKFLLEKRAWLKGAVADARKDGRLVGFVGGPPCPDFSVGGKNKGREGERGKLSQTFTQIILQQQPDFFLFENVKGLWQTKHHREFYEEIKADLQRSYITTERLINSIDYGAPQDRPRIILIGFKKSVACDLGLKSGADGKSFSEDSFAWDKEAPFPKGTAFNYPWPDTNAFQVDSKTECPSGIPEELTIQHWFARNDVLNHLNSAHCFTPRAGLARFLSVDEGDDSRKSFKRLHRWRYSPTVCYGNNEVHLHPYKSRRISVAEALALQSLPKDYVLPDNMSLSNMFKGIGNGVPFVAANAIAKTILSFINEEEK